MFEGYDENLYRMCKEAGLEAHFWKWTMNRAELLNVHPDWFAVNRKGESTHDKPAYVNYYRFCYLVDNTTDRIQAEIDP